MRESYSYEKQFVLAVQPADIRISGVLRSSTARSHSLLVVLMAMCFVLGIAYYAIAKILRLGIWGTS